MSGSHGVLRFGDEQMMNGGGGAGPEAGMLGEDVEGPLFAGPIYSNRPPAPRPAPNWQLYPSVEPMTPVPAEEPLPSSVQTVGSVGGQRAASQFARSFPETDEEPTAIRISITAPLKETGPSLIPGVNEPYYTYLVNTSTTLSAFSQPEMSVRRRFRDFVDLAKLLKLNFRGYFIPQRPHRNVYQGKIRMSPSFIEERRSNLEKYLRQLAVHPIISRSEELRAFLEARGQLRECLGWLQLHPMEPSWMEGATRLMRQLVGLERMVPTPSEVSQQPSVKRHMVRAVREKFKRIKDKRLPPMDFTAQEAQLRQEAEVMEEFQKAVDFAWKWASCWMNRYETMGQSFDRFGSALTAMSNFELDSGYMKIPGAAAVGKGCTDASALHLQYTNQTAKALAHIKEYQEQMKNVLGAFTSREKALTTLQTLVIDMEEKNLKLTQLEVTPGMSRKVQVAKQDIGALEASKAAAQASYEKLASLNAEELTRFREARRMDWSDMLCGFAMTQAAFATQSMELWCRVAEGLGADAKTLQAIKKI